MTAISPLLLNPYTTGVGASSATPGAADAASSASGTNASNGASSTSGASGTNASNGSSSTSGVSSNQLNQLANPQLFLKLLIAELQNQDPTNPMNPASILSQTASLSQMEAVTNMSKAVSAEQSATQASEATSLIGKTVTASVNNVPITGTVAGVSLSGSGVPTLVVNGTNVPLSDVTGVTDIAPATSPAAATTPAATTPAATSPAATSPAAGASGSGTAGTSNSGTSSSGAA